MPYRTQTIDCTIRGSCPLFVCRCCRTKFGWAHQRWCDCAWLTEPSCRDCRYCGARGQCRHPIKKRERGEAV